jgi:hypothetical protein
MYRKERKYLITGIVVGLVIGIILSLTIIPIGLRLVSGPDDPSQLPGLSASDIDIGYAWSVSSPRETDHLQKQIYAVIQEACTKSSCRSDWTSSKQVSAVVDYEQVTICVRKDGVNQEKLSGCVIKKFEIGAQRSQALTQAIEDALPDFIQQFSK